MKKLALGRCDFWNHLAAHAEASVHNLNHRLWPFLNGKTPCQAFFESTNKPIFTKLERKEIYYWVMEKEGYYRQWISLEWLENRHGGLR